jgi:hypothetical protein
MAMMGVSLDVAAHMGVFPPCYVVLVIVISV